MILTTLFAGESADHIRSCLTRGEIISVQGDLARLSPLNSLARLDPLDVFASAHSSNRLVAHTWGADRRAAQSRVTTDEVKSIFEQGATVSAEDFDSFYLDPVFGAFLDDVRVSTGAARVSSVYVASTLGDAFPLHFDSVDVIVIQLRGIKRWRLADNVDVKSPDASYFNGVGLFPERDARVSVDAPSYFPTQWTHGCNESTIDLKPGSVLFVPRGCWHQTTCLQNSASVTLRLRNSNTSDLVNDVWHQFLKRDLTARAEMRSALWGLFTNATAAESHVSGALDSLKQVVASLDERSVRRSVLGGKWCRCKGITVNLDENGSDFVLRVDSGELERKLVVPRKLVDFVRWLLDHDAVYELQLRHASESFLQYRGTPIAPEVFPALVTVGLFEACGDGPHPC